MKKDYALSFSLTEFVMSVKPTLKWVEKSECGEHTPAVGRHRFGSQRNREEQHKPWKFAAWHVGGIVNYPEQVPRNADM